MIETKSIKQADRLKDKVHDAHSDINALLDTYEAIENLWDKVDYEDYAEYEYADNIEQTLDKIDYFSREGYRVLYEMRNVNDSMRQLLGTLLDLEDEGLPRYTK